MKTPREHTIFLIEVLLKQVTYILYLSQSSGFPKHLNKTMADLAGIENEMNILEGEVNDYYNGDKEIIDLMIDTVRLTVAEIKHRIAGRLS